MAKSAMNKSTDKAKSTGKTKASNAGKTARTAGAAGKAKAAETEKTARTTGASGKAKAAQAASFFITAAPLLIFQFSVLCFSLIVPQIDTSSPRRENIPASRSRSKRGSLEAARIASGWTCRPAAG